MQCQTYILFLDYHLHLVTWLDDRALMAFHAINTLKLIAYQKNTWI